MPDYLQYPENIFFYQDSLDDSRGHLTTEICQKTPPPTWINFAKLFNGILGYL